MPKLPASVRAKIPGSRLTDWSKRCEACRMHKERCLCDLLPRYQTRTRLLLVVHRSEVWRTTNTGLVAARCFENCEVVVAGEDARAVPAPLFGPDERAVLLFPDMGATPLDALAVDGPLTLVVPDGSWRQARKRCLRMPALAELPRVRLPDGLITRYRLRTAKRESQLSTMEAIAHAIGILESEAMRDEMLRAFDAMVHRTLKARGTLERYATEDHTARDDVA